jgi:hypothetical protein
VVDQGGITDDWWYYWYRNGFKRIEDGRKMKFDEKVEIEQVIIAYDALTVLLIQQTVFLN